MEVPPPWTYTGVLRHRLDQPIRGFRNDPNSEYSAEATAPGGRWVAAFAATPDAAIDLLIVTLAGYPLAAR